MIRNDAESMVLLRVTRQRGGPSSRDGFFVDIPVLRTSHFDHYTYHDNGRWQRSRLGAGKKRLYDAVVQRQPLDCLKKNEFICFAYIDAWPYDTSITQLLAPDDRRSLTIRELKKVRWGTADHVVEIDYVDLGASGAICAALWLVDANTPQECYPTVPAATPLYSGIFQEVVPKLLVVLFPPPAYSPKGSFWTSPVPPWEDGTWAPHSVAT